MIDNSVKKVKEEGEKARVNLVCLRENAKELLNESSLVLEQLNIILKIEKDSAENTQNATNSVQKMKNDLNIVWNNNIYFHPHLNFIFAEYFFFLESDSFNVIF